MHCQEINTSLQPTQLHENIHFLSYISKTQFVTSVGLPRDS